jgi:hypothetical protein
MLNGTLSATEVIGHYFLTGKVRHMTNAMVVAPLNNTIIFDKLSLFKQTHPIL